MALASVAALWYLEQVNFPGREIRGSFPRRTRGH
jgi:hypothetical protein